MSKRIQEDAGEERVTAKSKPMTNLVSSCRVRDPTVLASTASENCEQNTLTRHISRVSQHTFQCLVTLAQGVLRARHPCIIRVVLLS